MTETFDTNLNLVVVRLVQERKKSHMDIPNHTGLYKSILDFSIYEAKILNFQQQCQTQIRDGECMVTSDLHHHKV